MNKNSFKWLFWLLVPARKNDNISKLNGGCGCRKLFNYIVSSNIVGRIYWAFVNCLDFRKYVLEMSVGSEPAHSPICTCIAIFSFRISSYLCFAFCLLESVMIHIWQWQDRREVSYGAFRRSCEGYNMYYLEVSNRSGMKVTWRTWRVFWNSFNVRSLPPKRWLSGHILLACNLWPRQMF